jgi:thymidylate kinase
MLNTKLILVEGLPGAGKSTTSVHMGTLLQQRGIPCRWYLEDDDPHPIACLDFELKDLTQNLPPLWRTFTEQARQDPTVTVIESRLWQNTALFMYMAEYSVEDILKLHQLVCQELTPLSPILLYLYQDHVEPALRRLYSFRDEEWMERDLQTTSQYQWFQSRGLNDFAGWVQFFQEWQLVAEQLYSDWPYGKTKVENPHHDWALAYQQIYRFLQVEHNQ